MGADWPVAANTPFCSVNMHNLFVVTKAAEAGTWLPTGAVRPNFVFNAMLAMQNLG